LAENPEYQAVKSEQEINEARIAELEDKLAPEASRKPTHSREAFR
jgi:transcription elongation GreA/GreB family factor